jgi:hypothetical protein
MHSLSKSAHLVATQVPKLNEPEPKGTFSEEQVPALQLEQW